MTMLTIRAIDLHYGAAQALKSITIEAKPNRITAIRISIRTGAQFTAR